MSQLPLNDDERSLRETAGRVLPGGHFGNQPSEIVIARGQAGRVWDVSGNEYIDYLLGSGPMLVGHAHPEVMAAVQEQLPLGTTFFVNNEYGIRLAAEIVDAVPCAEQVRFVSAGSEATLYAMRIARAFRRRDKVLKFEGGYHGMSDYSLIGLAPKEASNFPQGSPSSAGVPVRVRDEMLIAPFNDIAVAGDLVTEHADELAGIIVEPFQRLMPPKPGFLQGLRELADKHEIPLIFDEIVTGFRFSYGGAQAYYGVTPDICTLGKVIGGGFPLAAIVGRADIMAHFDKNSVAPEDFALQIGTLSGNPVAAAAGLATLAILKRPGAYESLFETGRRLMGGLSSRLDAAGIEAQIVGEPPLFDVVFTDRPVHDYRDFVTGDAGRMAAFNGHLLEKGILKGESKYYISLAHNDADIAHTFDAWDFAVARL